MSEKIYRIYLINKTDLLERFSTINHFELVSLFDCLSQPIQDQFVLINSIKTVEPFISSFCENDYTIETIVELLSIVMFTSDINSSLNKMCLKLLQQLIHKNKKLSESQILRIFQMVLCETDYRYHSQNIDDILCYVNHFSITEELDFDLIFNYILIVLNYLKNNYNKKLIDNNVIEMHSIEVNFVCDLYHSCFKAIHILLQKLKLLKNETISQTINNQVFNSFVNLIECEIFKIKVIPIGCLISASLVLCFILYLKEKDFNYIMNYVHEKEMFDERSRLALISSSYTTFASFQLNNSDLFYDFQLFKQLITYQNRNDTQFLILNSHLLLNWTEVITKILDNHEQSVKVKEDKNRLESISSFCEQLIEFVETNFDSSIDQIEYILKNLTLIKQSLLTSDHLREYLLRLYSQFNCKSKNNLSKYRLLTYICQAVGAKEFMDTFNELIYNLFDEIKLLLNERNDGLNEIVYFISVIISLPDQTVVKKWKTDICQLIMSGEDSQKSSQTNLMLNIVLPKLIKKHSSFVKSVLNQLLVNYNELNCKQLLHVIRLNKSLDDKFSNSIYYNECMTKTISHFEDEIRLDSLSLIIESRKTTQLLSKEDLELIRISFSYNICCQQSSNRQRFVALIKKLTQRLVDSLKASAKASKFHQVKRDYNDLIDFIVKCCFENLRATNYFGTTLAVLQIIQIINNSILPNDQLFPITKTIELKSYFLNLMSILSDSYEENKISALEVLIKYLENQIFNISHEQLSHIKEIANCLSVSVNPPDSVTAAYLFRLIANIEVFADKHKTKIQVCYELISNLLLEVNHFLEWAKRDIILSAAKYPLYTKLSCIRAIINEIDFKLISTEEFGIWKQLVDKVINVCYLSSQAVNSIVCNDSPEGHLPMDCHLISEEFIAKILNLSLDNISTEKVSHITSQMLLLCGWKTIKESAWLLAQLCQSANRSGLHYDIETSIINCKQANDIIEFLYSNLIQLKHRGAFEQTASAFTLLVESIWNNNCKCSAKVVQLLETIVQNLDNQQGSMVKGCVTRRSAGLPFVIQAALSGEPAIHNNKYFNYTMTELLKILSKQNAEDWQIIHCLNILRALIRDHRMVEKINPFVEESVKVCLIKFKSTSFAIRNCASMLFNSLITRIFGVKRNKEDNSKKNKMSSRLFFTNYPSLYDFLLQEIAICSQFENQVNSPSNGFLYIESLPLYPLLLLLSKLMPSISSTTIYNMNTFLPCLKNICFNCRHYKLRVLSSKIFAQLVQESQIEYHINESFNTLIDSTNISENYFHGLSLLFTEIIPIVPKKLYRSIVLKLEESIKIVFEKNLTQFSYYSLSSFVYVIEIALRKQILTFELKSKLSKLLMSIFSEEIVGRHRSLLKSDEYLVYLSRSIVLCIDSIEERQLFLQLLFSTNNSSCSEAKLIILKLIIESILNENKLFCDIAQEISYDSVFSVPSITLPNIRQSITESFYHMLLTSPELIKLIKTINQSSNESSTQSENLSQLSISASSYAFLTETFRLIYYSTTSYQTKMIPLFKLAAANHNIHLEELTFFINGFQMIEDDDLKYCILLLSAKILAEISDNNDYEKLNEFLTTGSLEKWSEIVDTSSQEDQSLLRRKVIAKVLKLNLKTFIQIPLNGEYIINLWKALINLIQDNDVDVRRQAVEIVMDIIGEKELMVSQKALEISVKRFTDNVCSFDRILCIYYLSKWMIELNEDEDCDDSDERLFDKSKLNTYVDKVLFIDILSKHLQSVLEAEYMHINDLKLPISLLMNSYPDKNFSTNEEAISHLYQHLSNGNEHNLKEIFLNSSCDLKSLFISTKIKFLNIFKNFTINTFNAE